MTPQFVDWNADGYTDILAATYDGSPHVALGSQEGFLEPEHVLDAAGDRVLLSRFWNYDTREWDDTGDEPEGHCTSARAFDWDGDGDFDLLMGDYGTGRLFLRMNAGTPDAPAFDGNNVPLEVGGKAFELEGGLASMQLVDWDGDGLEDLLCGGYGDTFGKGLGGGIVWCKNVGERGAPRFQAPRTLIERSRKGTRTPVRPDSGLHIEAVDWNGDGLLDLLVGGYSHWTPDAPTLTPEENARANELQASIDEQNEALQKLYSKTFEGYEELTRDEQEAYQTLTEALRKATEQLETLWSGDKREGSVWVYLRER